MESCHDGKYQTTFPDSFEIKDMPDDYPFIVQYSGIVKAQHPRFHVGNPCFGPTLLDFAVPYLYPYLLV